MADGVRGDGREMYGEGGEVQGVVGADELVLELDDADADRVRGEELNLRPSVSLHRQLERRRLKDARRRHENELARSTTWCSDSTAFVVRIR